MIRLQALPYVVAAVVIFAVAVGVFLEPWLVAFKGATAYEAQLGRVCVRLPFVAFLRAGCRPRVYLAPKDGQL